MLHSPPRNTDRLLCILFRKTTLYACIFLLPGSLSFCRLWCLCRHFTVHGLWCLFYLNALSGNTNTFVDTRQFLIRINTEIWQCFLQNFPRNALCIITVCLIFGISAGTEPIKDTRYFLAERGNFCAVPVFPPIE